MVSVATIGRLFSLLVVAYSIRLNKKREKNGKQSVQRTSETDLQSNSTTGPYCCCKYYNKYDVFSYPGMYEFETEDEKIKRARERYGDVTFGRELKDFYVPDTFQILNDPNQGITDKGRPVWRFGISKPADETKARNYDDYVRKQYNVTYMSDKAAAAVYNGYIKKHGSGTAVMFFNVDFWNFGCEKTDKSGQIGQDLYYFKLETNPKNPANARVDHKVCRIKDNALFRNSLINTQCVGSRKQDSIDACLTEIKPKLTGNALEGTWRSSSCYGTASINYWYRFTASGSDGKRTLENLKQNFPVAYEA